MGFRFFNRIGGRTGWGVNVSSSGLSSSYRSKYGAFGSKGFSIRTGIPGLSFRSGWGGGGKGNAALIFLLIIVALYLIYFAILVAYNILLFLGWIITELYNFLMRTYYGWKEKQALKLEAQEKQPTEKTI